MRSPSSASSFLLAHGGRLLWLLPFQFTIVHRVHLKTSHGEVIEKRNWFTIYFYYLFRPQLNCYPADSCRSFCWSIGHGWWWWILPCLASPCSRVSSSVLCRLPFGCYLASINIYLSPYSPVHHYYLYLHFIFIASASHTTCLPSEIGMGILASTVSPKMSRNFTFYHMQPPAFSISTIIDRSLLLWSSRQPRTRIRIPLKFFPIFIFQPVNCFAGQEVYNKISAVVNLIDRLNKGRSSPVKFGRPKWTGNWIRRSSSREPFPSFDGRSWRKLKKTADNK